MVAQVGGLWLVKRFALGRMGAQDRPKFMALKCLELCRKYCGTHLAVEDRTGYGQEIQSLGLRAEELSLIEVKAVLLPVTSSGTNRDLFETVLAEHPMLARYATDKKRGARSLQEQDRWRTVVLMAVAFAMAAKYRTTNQ